MTVLPVCMCTTHVPAASGSQKRESDPLGTGVMKHLMDVRDQTQVLCKSKKCWTISLTPTHFHVLLSSINQADGFIFCMAAHQGGNTTHLHGEPYGYRLGELGP